MRFVDLKSPRSAGLGATAAPVLVVALLVLMSGVSDPQRSVAEPGLFEETALDSAIPRPTLTPAQQAAIEYAASLPELDADASPFPEGQPEPQTPAPTNRSAPDQPEEQPMFTVTALVASDRGAVALINGKPHRQGDALPGGWSIQRIDAQKKIVVIEHGAGDTVRLQLHRPTSVSAPGAGQS